MISPKQVQKVIELLKQRVPKTTIAKQEDISRTKVTEIEKGIKNNNIENKEFLQDKEVEADPEIINLKKEMKKEELKRKIRELKEPFETEKKLRELEKEVDLLDFNCADHWERINKIEEKLGIE